MRLFLAAGVLLLGVIAGQDLTLRTFPEVEHPGLRVRLALSTTLSPEEVTRRWVVPIESALKEMGGVESLVGHVQDNGALVSAELAPGEDIAVKSSLLSSAIAALRRDLPAGSFLFIDSSFEKQAPLTAVVWFSGPGATTAIEEAQIRLHRRAGIGSVAMYGTPERWTRIVIPATRPDAVELASRVEEMLEEELRVHSLGELERRGERIRVVTGRRPGWSPAEMRVPMAGASLPLGALARIESRLEPPQTVVRFQGRRSLALIVRRESAADPLSVDTELREVLSRTTHGGAETFVAWSEAAPLRRLARRGAWTIGVACVLLALLGYRAGGAAGWQMGLSPLLGVAITANLLWLLDVPLDLHTSTAVLCGLVTPLPLAFVRSPGRRAPGVSATLLVGLAAVVPLAVELAGGGLRWMLREPALGYFSAVVGSVIALSILPRLDGRRLPGGAARGPLATLVRGAIRDPVTALLAGATLSYALMLWAGPALRASPREAHGTPVDLTIHVTLSPGSDLQETEEQVRAVTDLLDDHPSVRRYWSSTRAANGSVFVELAPRARRPESRSRFEAEIRGRARVTGSLEVTDRRSVSGSDPLAAAETTESLSAGVDAEDWTFFRFVLSSADLETLESAYRGVTRTLGSLGVGSREITGWMGESTRLEIEPREGVAQEEWMPWLRRIRLLASEPRLLYDHDGVRSNLSVSVGAPATPRPRLAVLLDQASTIESGRTGSSLFELRERPAHREVARRDGVFLLPMTVRFPRLTGVGRENRVGEIREALGRLTLPVGASLELPDPNRWRRGAELPDAWRFGGLILLLFVAAALVFTNRVSSVPLCAVVAALTLLVPAPWILLTLGRADELTLIALVGALSSPIALGVGAMAALQGRPTPAPAGTVYRAFRARGPGVLLGLAVGLAALLPLALTRDPALVAWSVPSGALALGMTAGVAAALVLMPAGLVGMQRLRSWSLPEAQARRRPAAWIDPVGQPTLETRNLAKTYAGGQTALVGVGFRLEPGISGLLGPNGAGKTTLLRLLVGLLHPTRGQIRFRGVRVDRFNESHFRSRIGFLPQEINAYPGVTGEQFVDLWALERGIRDPRERGREIERVLDLVELTDHAGRKVRTYSGGMRRRIGIAQALLGDPSILIVDEPTAGLDLESRLQLRRVLQSIARDRIVLVSTHLTGDIEALADRVLLLSEGRLRFNGTPERFLEAARGRVFEKLASPDELASLSGRFRLTGRVNLPEGVMVRLLAGGDLRLPGTPVEPTLEEAYLVRLDRVPLEIEASE